MIASVARGASLAARFIQEEFERQTRHLRDSAALGMSNTLREELAEVRKECSQPNWDGYDALPLKTASFANAIRLLNSMPLGTKAPSVGAIPNGHVSLEWHHSRRRSLTITLDEKGDLHYAALLDPGKTLGTEPFFDEVPQIILDLISRVFPC